MNVYISVDLEGIAGVTNSSELGRNGDRQDYQDARELMTAEANAAALGAFDAGADLVVMNDSHGSQRNLIIDQLDKRIELINGGPKIMGMMEGIDASYDATLFVGYHANMTALGVLSHTYSSACVAELKVNGKVLGEIGLNAVAASAFDVPVVFIAGDESAAGEGRQLLGDEITTVATKVAHGRTAARHKHPLRVREEIREQVAVALSDPGAVQPLDLGTPLQVELKFLNTGQAYSALIMPGAEAVDDLTVGYSAPDQVTAFRAVQSLINLAT